MVENISSTNRGTGAWNLFMVVTSWQGLPGCPAAKSGAAQSTLVGNGHARRHYSGANAPARRLPAYPAFAQSAAGKRPAAVFQGGKFSAHRLLQAPRRLQQDRLPQRDRKSVV